MRLNSLLLFALLSSACACGSSYIEAPSPFDPDPDYCRDVERTLAASTISTPVPIPFSGPRNISLWTRKPHGWDDFEGSIHLRSMAWNVDWINNGTVQVGGITIAQLHNGDWSTNFNADIRPAISVNESGDLEFGAKLRGTGIKPTGSQIIAVTVTAAFCGIGRDAVADGFAILADFEVR